MPSFDFIDVLEARQAGDMDKLNEASLGRVFQHVKDRDETSYGLITSWRGGVPSKENNENLELLKNMLRSAGLGFFRLKGHGMEKTPDADADLPFKDVPKEQLIDTVEPTLFVPGISLKYLVLLMNKFNQDFAIYSGPETMDLGPEESKDKVAMVSKNGTLSYLGEFKPDQITQFYSQVKNYPFTFEYVAQTFGEMLLEKFFTKK